jgi:Peptidase inhibitor family I36
MPPGHSGPRQPPGPGQDGRPGQAARAGAGSLTANPSRNAVPNQPSTEAAEGPRRLSTGLLGLSGLPAPPRWLVGRLREAIGLASLLVVALVPGAAMAGSAITVAVGAYCSFGSFCLYSGPNFDGQRVEYDSSQLFCQDSMPALDLRTILPGGVRSVVNNTRTSATGIGVKFFSEPAHLVLTSVRPGSEERELPDGVAKGMASLCAYPGK